MEMNKELLNTLITQYGSPLYVFDVEGFKQNYNKLHSAMADYYPDYQIAYSYKTNYTPYICKLVKNLGGYAEVVSDMEYQVALQIGYTADHIVYNGPVKGPLMEQHLLNGGILNIDNEAESERVISLALNNPDTHIKVGIRINTDIGANFISRFGIDVDDDSMDKVVGNLKKQPNISIVGLHMHVSRARGIEAWKRRIDNILSAADKYIDGIPEYIDLGSGMFAEMEEFLRSQFSVPVPNYHDYAKVVAGTMCEHYKDSEIKPLLMTEPGTTVVSRYLSLITTVTGLKKVRSRLLAMVDTDIHNAGETCRMMNVPYTHYHIGNGKDALDHPDIVGYTCLEQDCLYKSFPESVSVGDVIEFRNIGGYSIVYKPPFIQPNCAMVAIEESGEVKLIKRKESFNDIFQTFIF